MRRTDLKTIAMMVAVAVPVTALAVMAFAPV